jgi:hypothetical protein
LLRLLQAHKRSSRHLSGFQRILEDKAFQRRLTDPMASIDLFSPTGGGRAAFWNFARADCLAAYLQGSTTQLDTDNLTIWMAAGLQIDEKGTLLPEHALDEDGVVFERCTRTRHREDVVCCALFWIVAKTVNFVAPSRNDNLNTASSPTSTGRPATDRLAHWEELRSLLSRWHSALPFTFQPYATNADWNAQEAEARFTSIHFTVPMCAAALQLYHFAQVLLLLNQPIETTGHVGLASRFRMFRDISEEAEYHSRQICGIALGRPPSAVRRQMLQPLHVAGLCLEAAQDRNVVIEILRDIEKDTGCLTTHVVQDLQNQWGRG